MTRLPDVGCERVIRALQRDGSVVVRQRDSHIRLHKHTRTELLKLTIQAHHPIKRSTLAHILKQARITVEEFEALLYNPFRSQGS
jgi:predicted RNA binding protein YcfA (HicA-like mRNA interferase family)